MIECPLNIFGCNQIIIFMLMDKNMSHCRVLKSTRINILKNLEKITIKDRGFVNFIHMKYEAIKMIRFEFDWNNAINKLTINGIKLISRLTEFLSTSKVRE